jgi:hypothetical protein
MRGLPKQTIATILQPNLSAVTIFSFSERSNVISHNHIPLTLWDKIDMVSKIRNL